MGLKRVKRIVDGELRNVWQFDTRLNGRRVRSRDNFPTKDECRAALDSIRADSRRGHYRFPADNVRYTVRDARDAWVAHLVKLKRHPKHVRLAEHAFELFAKIIPPDAAVALVTADCLSAYVDLRDRSGVRRGTVFNELTQIRAALNHAAETVPDLEYWRPPKKPSSVVAPNSRRKRIITRDEESKLIDELRRPLLGEQSRYTRYRLDAADLFEIAINTGMRPVEMFSLAWSDVHFDRSPAYRYGWINVRATKTANRTNAETDDRDVPMNARVAEIMGSRKRSCASPLVFPSIFSTRLGPRYYADHAFKNACLRARIPYGRDTPGGVVFYDTRHTFITRALQNGADLQTVMDVAGHRKPSTTLGYTHSTPLSRFRAVACDERPVHELSAPDADADTPDNSGQLDRRAQLAPTKRKSR